MPVVILEKLDIMPYMQKVINRPKTNRITSRPTNSGDKNARGVQGHHDDYNVQRLPCQERGLVPCDRRKV